MLGNQRSAEVILQGRHLTRTFGVGATLTRALDDVSLDVRAGEVVVLMGPSGSGKSTLLAILSGLLPPSEGQVSALGEDLWALSDVERQEFRLRHCSFVFQSYNLFPALSARQQLEMVLRLGERAPPLEARRRAGEMLDVLGLGDRAHLRPDELSGGEKQRVAVARALVKNPAFFFADEPTAALDWPRGSQVVALLCEAAHARGACVFMVSHDPRLSACADRLYDLEDGRLRVGRIEPRPLDAATLPLAIGGVRHEP
jgi:putative ABC transport system ATP-binding protein